MGTREEKLLYKFASQYGNQYSEQSRDDWNLLHNQKAMPDQSGAALPQIA